MYNFNNKKHTSFSSNIAVNSSYSDLPNSNVIQLFLEKGAGKISIRPSGTEPKIKLYISLYKETNTDKLEGDKKEINKQLRNIELSFSQLINNIIKK